MDVSFLFELLITKTFGLTLLMAIILTMRPVVLKRLNAKVAYALWLTVPIFLLLPLTFVEQSIKSSAMTFFPGASELIPSFIPQDLLMSSGSEMGLVLLWLVGVLFSSRLYWQRYQKLGKSFYGSNYQLPEQQLTHKASFNPHAIKIVSTPLVDMPAIFGLFKGLLILPENFSKLSNDKQVMILRHEFYHLARKDHQVNLLRAALKSLFWFNPLVYWADKIIEADQEMSCDLGVLENSLQVEKRNYAEALVESMAGSLQTQNQNYLISQWKYQSLIKQRVKMLKNTNQKKWHSLVAAGLAITSVWATSVVVAGEKNKPESAVPIVVIQPDYPRRAVDEGLEGWVKFEMNIDSNGRPYEVKVIEAQPKRVFESSARKAIYQWKFKPRMVDGKATTQHNMHYTMEFKLGSDTGSVKFPPPPPKDKKN